MFEDICLLKGDDWPFDVPTETLDADGIARLRSEQPHLPEDYLAYLATVGWGSLAGSRYMIYGGPLDPDSVYGRVPDGMEHMLLIGDDFSGYCAGIRLADGVILEADGSGDDLREIAPSFEIFVRDLIAGFMRYSPSERDIGR